REVVGRVVVGNHAWTGRALINQRPVGDRHTRQAATVVDSEGRGNEVAAAVSVSGAQFGNLADAAGDRILVTLRAGLSVVDRAETLGHRVPFFEGTAVLVMYGLSNEAVG